MGVEPSLLVSSSLGFFRLSGAAPSRGWKKYAFFPFGCAQSHESRDETVHDLCLDFGNRGILFLQPRCAKAHIAAKDFCTTLRSSSTTLRRNRTSPCKRICERDLLHGVDSVRSIPRASSINDGNRRAAPFLQISTLCCLLERAREI